MSIRLKAESDGQSKNVDFEVTFDLDCTCNVPTVEQAVEDFTYVIGFTAVTEVGTTRFRNSLPDLDCSTYSLEAQGNPGYLTFDDSEAPTLKTSVTADVANYGDLDGTTQVVRVIATSAGTEYANEFTITFTSECRTATLTAANFDPDNYSVALFEAGEIDFTPMTAATEGNDCGPITYQLFDATTDTVSDALKI